MKTESTALASLYAKIKTLIGKKRVPKTLNGDIYIDMLRIRAPGFLGTPGPASIVYFVFLKNSSFLLPEDHTKTSTEMDALEHNSHFL